MDMSGEKSRVIGTHNGNFHADEVLGCFLLKQLPEYKDAIIKRTRNPEELNSCDIVIDVGGLYDHPKKRYDHHQKNFVDTLRTITGVEGDIKLSSAGLVWAHYGKDVITTMVEQKLSQEEIQLVYVRLYKYFVMEIDGKDNGIETSDPPHRYQINSDLSSRVARLNNKTLASGLEEDNQFMKAVELVGKEFSEVLEETVKYWLPARIVVAEALENRFSVDPSGRIIKLDNGGVKWSAHLIDLEAEKGIVPEILFVLFPDRHEGWRVQAVGSHGGFVLRKQILANCLALRNEELVAACGIAGAFFVHATGFIGGGKSYEDALKMAQMSLDVQST